ncbi:hypothetical protein L596_001922 [Steinernema carpocapsae]|uniref:Dipeptidyl peptidase 3 n=1 Tax=Steinernema carpocapsae TaxID=34508 RepID=A0A4U8UMZ8_STECR|nr:hypothetical protein L596_001922 [Steinernema carpocapsae]
MSDQLQINPLYVLSNDTPIVKLDCEEAFNGLTEQQKRYAHFIARASFEGALSVYSQVSPESPAIFCILYHLFACEPIEVLRQKAEKVGFTADEFQSLLIYSAGFFANSGNYKGFGDVKFIPNVSAAKIGALLEVAAAASQKPEVLQLFEAVKPVLHRITDREASLGFNPEHVTTYHSSNVTREECEIVGRFLKDNGIEAYNSRLLKPLNGEKTLIIWVASSETMHLVRNEEWLVNTENFEGYKIVTKKGDHAPFMARTIYNLKQAIEHAANDDQQDMLRKYCESFETGYIYDHKDGSRLWIRDRAPAVESYIGFIENYRDPAGVRGAVNVETSKVFQELTRRAPELLMRLPWGADYEKDTFLKPDFTALDVIAFAGSGIPSGINIPNYDDLRQYEGFKNVTLSNVISAMPKQRIPFLSKEDEALYVKYFRESFNVQVGLHELLGHGSGKLFAIDKNGKFNFDRETVRDLVDGGEIKTWYEPGETWSSKFGEISNAYEECRAEAVGYYLSCFNDVLKIFGHEGQEARDVKYVNWLNELRAGLCGLEFYNPDKKIWGQAHSRARFALLKVCLAAGNDFVTIQEVTGEDGQPDLLFTVDRKKIEDTGKSAIEEFLILLQYHKSTASPKLKDLFEAWSTVKSNDLRWREIVMARRTPRRFFLQSNTSVKSNGNIALHNYPNTVEGLIESVVDRYNDESVQEVQKVWEDNSKYFLM